MSTLHAALLRRRSGLGSAVVALLATAALAGCGDRFGPGSEAQRGPGSEAQRGADEAQAAAVTEAAPLAPPAATATTPVEGPPPGATPTTPPTTSPTEAELGETTNVGGVIWQPRAMYDGPVQIGVRDGFLAAVVPSGELGELRVAPDGGAPVAAQGAGRLPSWARPHVGTDVSGRTVVTYPRCQDPQAVGTCDIYQWTAQTGREVVLRGVSGTALAETEAVMEFGDVLVVREKRPVLSADDLLHDRPPLTTLLFKPRGRPLQVVTRHGGRQIDLRGSRVADVSTLPASSPETCPDHAARALTLDGQTVASRVVKCATGSAAPTGPSVADNHLRFAITTPGKPGVALDHDLATGRTREAKLTLPVEWWTADGQRSGFGLDTVLGAGRCSAVKFDAPTPARCRILRSAKLVWKPVDATWKVTAGDAPVRD